MHGWREENSTCGAVQSELGLERENCFILFFFSVENTAARSSRTVSLVVFCRPKAVS